MHALIIEQDAWVAFMIEAVLREFSYDSFSFATTVEEAQLAAERSCPDLVTSDALMGWDSIVEDVTQICSATGAPLVYVTAVSQTALDVGSEVVIVSKPCSHNALADAVARVSSWPI